MKCARNRSAGSAIVFVMAVVMVLAILALTFARMADTERRAAHNFSDKVDSRLCALAGIEMAIASISDELGHQGYTDLSKIEWRYPHAPGVPLREAVWTNYPLEPNETTGISYEAGIDAGLRYSGILGIPGNRLHCYALKIIDCSALINLNSHIAIPSRPATTVDQRSSNRTLHRIVSHLAELCGISNADASAIANLLVPLDWDPHYTDPTQPLPQRWTSMLEVQQALQNLSLGCGNKKIQKFLDCITVHSWIDTKTCKVWGYPNATVIPNYTLEARSPININTASQEVLASVLWGLQASPVLIDRSTVRRSKSNDGTMTDGELYDETSLHYTTQRIQIQAIPDSATANDIAARIIMYRSYAPFKNWSGFHVFVESQLSIGQDLPYDPAVIAKLHPGPPSPDHKDLGKIIWNQTCWDIIKANFNPNAVDNFFNPSAHAFFRTVKSDLFVNTGTQLTCTHTTEFCFAPMGCFRITSLGQVYQRAYQKTIASTAIEVELSLLDILRHTTQADFETPLRLNAANYPPQFRYSTSYPNVMGKNLNWSADPYVGRIEPLGIFPQTNNPLYASNFAPQRGHTPSLPPSNSERFTHYPGPSLQTMCIGSSIRDASNNLTNDGILSHLRQAIIRYHSIPAIPAGVQRGVNCPSGSNVAYYHGALEFWVKLTEPSYAQSACGLISITMVNPDPPYNTAEPGDPDILPKAYSEGVQFYIFKNTLGELRFSRIYFCLTFDNAGSLIGTHYTTDADGWDIANKTWKLGVQSQGLYFPRPRQDVVVRNIEWEAHTWHHVWVAWNNIDPDHQLSIAIDGVKINSLPTQTVERTSEITDPEYCLLNEKGPRDCFNICGFFRPQVDASRGLFKFGRDIHIPANATICGVRTYRSTSKVFPHFHFSDASYTHNFGISTHSRLVGLSWTAYPSRLKGGPYVTVDATLYSAAGAAQANYSTPSQSMQNGYDGDGLYLHNRSVGPGYRLEYTVSLYPQDNDIPVLEDITLTLFKLKFFELREF